jgi:hypothetical protein
MAIKWGKQDVIQKFQEAMQESEAPQSPAGGQSPLKQSLLSQARTKSAGIRPPELK